MSLSITQNPAYLNLSQSPIIFVVKENNTTILNKPTFQYNAKIYCWTGDINDVPSTEQYTIVKYKNSSGYGIFDLSKILNSLFTESLLNNTSNIWYFKCVFYTSYWDGTQFVYGTNVPSDKFKVAEGYKIFGDELNAEIDQITDLFPFMTDGPEIQYHYDNQITNYIGVFSGILNQNNVNPFSYPVKFAYCIEIYPGWEPTYMNIGSTLGTTSFWYDLSVYASYNTTEMIQQIPISKDSPGFPIPEFVLENRNFYIVPFTSGGGLMGKPIKFEFKCKGKYENIVIKFKNRYGQFDIFNFNLVSQKTFNSENVTYRKQIGDWSGTSFTYSNSDYSEQVYGTSQTQFITVNTDYVEEGYNDVFKQMLISDEIYWVTPNRNIPLVLTSNSFIEKSERVDKLINYTFTFKYSQPYKIII